MFTALANWDAASSATGSELIEWVHHTTQDDGRMCEKGQCKVTQYADSLSLVPRPSLHPNFITSSVQNEEGRPIMCIRGYIDTQGQCPIVIIHKPASSLLNNELYWHCLSSIPVSNPWTRCYKNGLEILHEASSPCVYLPLRHITMHVKNLPNPFLIL